MVGGSLALSLEGLSCSLMVDYLSISLDIGMVFYYYAIIFFKSRIVVLGARWEV